MQSNLYLPLNILKVVVADLVFIALTSCVVLILNLSGVIGTYVSELVLLIFIVVTVTPLYIERKYILRRIFS